MWVRYKHKFSYGTDKEWTIIEVADDWYKYGYTVEDWKNKHTQEELLGFFLEDEMGILEKYSYSDSDHYRGFDYEILEEPPISYILKSIKEYEAKIEYSKKKLKYFQDMLDKTGYVKKEDFEV
jgi:hypothetical protein